MASKQAQSQAVPKSPPPPLTASYQPPVSAYDEFLGPNGQPRPAWAQIARRIDAMGAVGVTTAWKRGLDLLRENGIEYNVGSDNSETERRWSLDPIPVVLSQDEWDFLAGAVSQRAMLWKAILEDCYGPRKLLQSGLIPPALIFSQPNFNRSLCEPRSSRQPLLTFYAVDVTRGPNGAWTVVADRTEAPNGNGFALENRVALTNVFPETSTQLRLLRLATFFQSVRANLFNYAQSGVDDPRVVLLSSGPGDFEDAYLARYLGIQLAVGDELTVRNDRLYLKTVSGLQRVHVIFRRIHEMKTDPLDMPTESHLGVPGLMQAMRSGSVVLVNPPGSGLAEAPAFLPFLPAISQQLLGEDLIIPSIETTWGGQFPDLLARAETDGAIIKEAFQRQRFNPTLLRNQTPAQRKELERLIAASPERFVMQREMQSSTAPTWTGSTLEARPIAFRLFLLGNGDSYSVMPGGLVRSAASPDSFPGLSLNHDSGSKDLWILGRETDAVPVVSNLPGRQSVRRSTGSLSSRSADNLLWIGRYSERAEYATRIILEIVLTVAAERDSSNLPAIPPLLQTLVKRGHLSLDGISVPDLIADRRELLQLLNHAFFDAASSGPSHLESVPKNVARLHDLASLSRERLSNETWRVIRSLEAVVKSTPAASINALRPILQQAILYHSAFNGTCRNNLTRNQGWHFLNIGRKLEAASWLLALVEEILPLHPELPSTVLDSILSINDTTLTYRYRYQGAPQPLPTIDLVLFEPTNPRSLAFQLAELDRSLSFLPSQSIGIPRQAHRTILRALHYLETEVLDAEDLEAEKLSIRELQDFIATFRKELPDVADHLGWEFFTHVDFTSS